MKHVCLTAFALLGGCMSTTALQQQEPAVTFASDKSVPALEECVALNLAWLGNPSTIRGEQNVIISYGQPTTALAVTISDRGDDRLVSVRASLAAGTRVRRNVGSCV